MAGREEESQDSATRYSQMTCINEASEAHVREINKINVEQKKNMRNRAERKV